MKQQFELSERLEREKKNLEDLNELEIRKVNEEFEQRRSTQIAENEKLVTFSCRSRCKTNLLYNTDEIFNFGILEF